ncbi:MAG TPA: substrate-binding domain-containing protein [Thermoanaerobaculia bacterium]|nr:substrate-binding domain-containing protein [Thermoanaerobaculia bacterium]
MRRGLFLGLTTIVLAAGLSWAAGCRETPPARVRLATTTSIENAGLLQVLRSQARRALGIELEAFVVGSGAALRMAQDGTVEVAITHDPRGEEQLRLSGTAAAQAPLFENRFLLVGPPGNPAAVPPEATVLEALRLIHGTEARFASRGDGSGTHVRELELWRLLGIDPSASGGYVRMGQGMSGLLRSADQMEAYALTDEATFARMRGSVRLVPVADRGEGLLNLYVVSLVQGPEGRVSRSAAALFEWLAEGGASSALREFEERGGSGFRLAEGSPETGGVVVVP